MSGLPIEVVLKPGGRQERLWPLRMRAQISAVKDLITVTRQQFVANQIDTDASSDLPVRDHRFNAYFFVPGFDGVINITSFGLPDAQDTPGLFLSINYKNEVGKIVQLVLIQTAKVPEVVGKKEALGFSKYLPKQLLRIAEIVRTANPISPETYLSYFQEPRVLARVGQEAEITTDTPKKIEEEDGAPPPGIDGWTMRRAREGNEDGHKVR